MSVLTQADAARRLGVTPQRVVALIKKGRLATRVIAGRPHVTLRSLDRLIAARASK